MVQIPASLPVLSVQNTSQLPANTVLSPQAAAMLETGMAIPDFLSQLQAEKLSFDMVKVISGSLPEREGVLWATKSTETVDTELDPEAQKALEAAKQWVENPSAEAGQAALEAAKTQPADSPAGWAANAAAFAEGDAASAGELAMDKESGMVASAVTGAVVLSSKIKAEKDAISSEKVKEAADQIPDKEALADNIPEVETPSELPEEAASEITDAAKEEVVQEIPAEEVPEIEITPPEKAIPEFSPEEREQMAAELDPYIEIGIQIADGKLAP